MTRGKTIGNAICRLGYGILAMIILSAIGHSALAQTPTAQKAEEATVSVLIKTSMGEIVLELDHAKAPITVENFLKYVDEGFYNGVIFHRVIPKFMVQTGGFLPDMSQKKPGASIQNEWKNGLTNVRGSIAMARLGGQANSATSQFFINVADNSFLDQPRDGAGYAVFGKVIQGMDVVDKIQNVKTSTVGQFGDVPVQPIIMEKVTRLDKKAKPAAPDETKKDTAKSGTDPGGK